MLSSLLLSHSKPETKNKLKTPTTNTRDFIPSVFKTMKNNPNLYLILMKCKLLRLIDSYQSSVKVYGQTLHSASLLNNICKTSINITLSWSLLTLINPLGRFNVSFPSSYLFLYNLMLS